MELIYIIVGILVVLAFIIRGNTESYTVNRVDMTKKIIEHQELFDDSNYADIKSKLPWMDAAIYGDVKSLRFKKFPITHETVNKILN